MNHLDLARACLDAYQDGPEVLSSGEVDVLHRLAPEGLILAVRGTEASETPFGVIKRGELHKLLKWQTWRNTNDIIRDLMFWPHETLHGGVHRGFYKSAHQWLRDYKKILSPSVPIYLTGHSLGAATAAQMALMLADSHEVKSLVVFGEPASLTRESHDALAKAVPVRRSYVNSGIDGRFDWITRAYTGLCGWTCSSRYVLHGDFAENYHPMRLYVERLSALRGE